MSGPANRLIHETSPYLRQHAYNPVDWQPWDDEAFQKAADEDKPVFLSIGYAACHWCHVMEEESFENDSIARFMNEHFICIKVDREERPDIDQVYMRFVQMTTGSGGWPMSVFLTPQGEPFYGGTYFPPEDRYGRPGFMKILNAISEFYTSQRTKLNDHLVEINEAYLNSMTEPEKSSIPSRQDFERAIGNLANLYEPEFGGIGQAPKFPASQSLQLFLRQYRNSGDSAYLKMAEHTLQQMGKGGIFDQLGGGFARYSVDNEWLAPHFEKMLYDNAQLSNLYLDTYQITGDPFYLRIAEETLEFVSRELLSPEGGFYSSLDADSEGEEGKYYIWEKQTIIDLLGLEAGEIFCHYFDVTRAGNFENKNILRVRSDIKTLAQRYSKTPAAISEILEDGKSILLNHRATRVRPGLDDKVIVSWNGLMLSAFARMYQVTNNEKYGAIVGKNIEFLKSRFYKDGRLLHTYKEGIAKFEGFLDDYANLTAGLIDAYEALFDPELLVWAKELIDVVNTKFRDEKENGYFFTSADQETLYQRLKDDTDQSIPSGTGIMIMNMLRLYYYSGDAGYLEMAEGLFKKYGSQFIQNPYGYASFLNALDFYLQTPKEIILLSSDSGGEKKILETISGMYLPNKILIRSQTGKQPKVINPGHLKGKTLVGAKTTVYVCQNFVCSKPVQKAAELKNLLQ